MRTVAIFRLKSTRPAPTGRRRGVTGEAIPLLTILGAEHHVTNFLEFLDDAIPASVHLSIYQAVELRGPETAAWALLELEAATPEGNHDVHKQMAVALRNLFVLRLGGGRFIPLPHFKWAISACFDRDLRSKLLLAHHHLFRPN